MIDLSRIYPRALRAAGAIGVVLGASALAARGRMSLQDLLVIGLVIPTSWIRINLEPKGYVTLAPLAMFTGFLLADSSVAVFVAAVSPFVGTLVLNQRQWARSLEEAGGETTAVLVGVLLVSLVGGQSRSPGSPGWLEPFAVAAVGYICARLLLSAADARVSRGVGFLTYFNAAGKAVVANLSLLAILAVGMSYLANAYGKSGNFILALATAVVVETYHPFKQLSDQRDVLFASLAMVAHAIDLKDAYTGRHARDASDIAVRIARALHLSEPEVRKVRLAGMLHDIGKIGVSIKIIRKPSSLNPEEAAQMRQHPVIGAEIMRPVELLSDASDIVRHHHEHFDGSGYPDGLSGDQIPVGARVVLVADAFNAITTDRPYRKARSKGEALEVLKKNSGTQFDPLVVRALEGVIHLVP
jgi:putative nucleotidyltransferase with HDIG domain